MADIVEIIDAGANPVLCKCAIKPIISGIATGRSGTMSIDCINRTNFDHALSYCVLVDGDSDACISLSILVVMSPGKCGRASRLV